MCTETEPFPDGIAEICTVHRDRTPSLRYIKIVYCAQIQNTLLTVHQICILCTETEHFHDGTSEMCTAHRNRTLS